MKLFLARCIVSILYSAMILGVAIFFDWFYDSIDKYNSNASAMIQAMLIFVALPVYLAFTVVQKSKTVRQDETAEAERDL